MAATTSPLPLSSEAKFKESYTFQWIADNSSGNEPQPALYAEASSHSGIATRLYTSCLDLVDNILSTSAAGKISGESELGMEVLRGAFGSFFMWGEGLKEGGLDKVVASSEELGITILELLCRVGEQLIKGTSARNRKSMT